MWSRRAAGRADDDMGATLQRAAFGARVHAADAGGDGGAGFGVEPGEFAHDLKRQFARRCDDEGERRAGALEALTAESRSGASARPKATVLPEPVWAETSASRPSRSVAITAFCTGVSCV